jgi:hypothetical protein
LEIWAQKAQFKFMLNIKDLRMYDAAKNNKDSAFIGIISRIIKKARRKT